MSPTFISRLVDKIRGKCAQRISFLAVCLLSAVPVCGLYIIHFLYGEKNDVNIYIYIRRGRPPCAAPDDLLQLSFQIITGIASFIECLHTLYKINFNRNIYDSLKRLKNVNMCIFLKC